MSKKSIQGFVKAVGSVVTDTSSTMFVELKNGQTINFDNSKQYRLEEV